MDSFSLENVIAFDEISFPRPISERRLTSSQTNKTGSCDSYRLEVVLVILVSLLGYKYIVHIVVVLHFR